MSNSDRILATKLLAPRTGARLLPRPRLTEICQDFRIRKLTLISAPAGYGKTVLLTQLAAQVPWPTAWYQLDHFDNDLAVFVQHLSACIRMHMPGFSVNIGVLPERKEEESPELRQLAASFLNNLTAVLEQGDNREQEQGLLLVIDDYQSIEAPAVHCFMELFLEYLPEGVHVILAGRTVPPLHLARLKLAGLVLEVGQEDLKFNKNEIAGYLVSDCSEPVSGDIISLLENETEGWPAALCLAGLSLEGLKNRQKVAVARTLPSRKEFYNYLAEEVLRKLPQEMQEFVVDTSVLDVMTPRICDIFLQRSDSSSMLESLEAQNLFTTAMEGREEVYRYHHLFRDFLQSCLGERHNSLLSKAGRSYLQVGYPIRAVECFLKAGDYASAITPLKQAGQEMLRLGRWQTVRRWLQELPAELAADSPHLLLLEGAVNTNSGKLQAGEKALRQAEKALKAEGDRESVFQARLYLARILRSYGSYQEGALMLQEVLPLFTSHPVTRWADAAMELSLNLGMQGKFAEAVKLLNKALIAAEKEGEPRIAGQLAEKLVEAYYLIGDYSRAVEVHQRAVEMAPDTERMSFSLRDTMAMIYRDWGDLEQAYEYARYGIKVKEQLGLTEALPYAYHQLAVILADMGNEEEAAENFLRAMKMARELGGEFFFLVLSLALYGRLKERQGLHEEALSLVEEALKTAEKQTPFIYAVCLEVAAPVYVSHGRYQEALQLLQQALKILEHIEARYVMCLTCGEIAAVYWHLRDEEKAEDYARRCLTLAAGDSYVQMFLSNRDIMLPVIRIGLEKNIEAAFVDEILKRMGEGASELLVELTKHADPAVRQRIVDPLNANASPEAVGALQEMLLDPEESVRDSVLASLPAKKVEETGSTAAVDGQRTPSSGQGRSASLAETVSFKVGPPLTVRCLGTFQVTAGEEVISWRTTKARDLFAYLMHHNAKPVAKEKLLEDLWPEADPEQASTLFHTNLYQMRKGVKPVLGSRQLVKHSAGHYRLDMELLAWDLEEFERLSRAVSIDSDVGKNRVVEIEEIERAASLYQGEYLDGLDYDWVFPERERLTQLYHNVLEKLARHYLKVNAHSRAVSCLRAILKANPLLEEVHCLLMTAYARMGDRMAVMQQYETLTHVLEEELGIDPGLKTRELYYKLCGDEE